MKNKSKLSETFKEQIIEEIENLKARDVISVDISKVSTLADYIVIATGRSSKHLDAIAAKLRTFLKTQDISGLRPEGGAVGGWVVLDLGAVIVHLFTQEVREKYNLEQLWNFKR